MPSQPRKQMISIACINLLLRSLEVDCLAVALPVLRLRPYAYGWARNNLNPPGDPNPMVYNDGDQLVRCPGIYRYSYDSAGNPIKRKEACGSTRLLTDSNGNITDRYTYITLHGHRVRRLPGPVASGLGLYIGRVEYPFNRFVPKANAPEQALPRY